MKKKNIIIAVGLFAVFSLVSLSSFAQNLIGGKVSGNFQADVKYALEDSLIGAPDVPENLLMNAFANILYTNGSFTAGFRYESYLNPIPGFDPRYKGSGIPYRFASFRQDDFEITVGNFYEQFGSGLILRAYEERNLGVDNAFDGIKVKYTPFKGITLKGLIGTQRNFWDKGPGIVRAADAEFYLNDFLGKLKESKTRISIGGSVVSKYQRDEDPIYKLPENVSAFAGRLNFTRGKVNLMGEYAYKINDPSSDNRFIYKPGEALYITSSYSRKGLGVTIAAKRIDNMSFRSDRTATLNSLLLNFIPESNKKHTYSLSSIYPYATQPNGEMGFEAEIAYMIKKKTKLGGKYGTFITLNYSQSNSIDMEAPTDTTGIMEDGTLGYKSDFFKVGDKVYFKDFNVEVSHKFSKKVKAILSWVNLVYNIDVIEGHTGDPTVYANIVIADIIYKFTRKKSLQLELQHLSTRQDKGDWAMLLLEYYMASKWFFGVSDQYNYGNPESDLQIHYYSCSLGFVKNSTRVVLSYGKQRKGIICVGGVCREEPAFNGVSLSLSSSF